MARRRRILWPIAAVGVLAVGLAGIALSSVVGGSTAQAATTAGCGRAPALSSGTHTIQSSGKSRSFVLRVPNNYNNNNPYRLVFGFHWLNGSASNVVSGQYYGLVPLANESAIFVAPQGLNAGWGNNGGEDVTFTDDMIRTISNALCVDTSLIFSTGFSFGGGMSFALACARPSVIRAVAVIAGGQISGCSGGNDRVAYLGIHGINDSVLSISGGRTLRDRFVRNNGCAAQNPREPGNGQAHIVTAYTGCAPGYPVVWAAHDGGHVGDDSDPGSNVNWMPGLTWQFFTQFSGSTQPTTPPTTRPTTPPTTRPTTPPTTPPTTAPTTPPTTVPTTTPPTVPTNNSGCTATYRVVGQWSGGFQGEVVVRNNGSAAIAGWTVTWTFPNGQTITQIWGGTNTPNGASQSIRNVSWSGNVPPAGSTTFGFLGSWNGANGVPSDVTCTVA